MRIDNKSIFYDSIKDTIRCLTLFSKELRGAFRDKEYVLHTLKALSVLEVTKEMEDDMRIDVEEWMENPAGKRGASRDALITFKKHGINVEIQRVDECDGFQREMSYMEESDPEIDDGLGLMSSTRYISLWICAFDPFPEKGLPYYIFSYKYKRHEGIRGTEDEFDMFEGSEFIFVNGSYIWNDSPLTEEEEALRDFVMDIKKPDPNAILNESARRVLSEYKEGGAMYDKIELAFKECYESDYERAKQEGREEESRKLVSAMLENGMSYDLVSKISGLTKEQIMAIEK